MKRSNDKIYAMEFSSVYPLYVKKAERKGRTKDDVDKIICWLTGHNIESLNKELKLNTDFKTFFESAPKLNPKRILIKGVVCGVKIEEIEDELLREIRYLDKLIDELAKGRDMEKILRK